MLVDAKDRAALDEDEGDNQLLIGFDNTNEAKPSTTDPAPNGGGGLLDLDLMLGGPTTTNAPPVQLGDNMMDLFGGGSSAPVTQAPSNDLMGGLSDIFGGGAPS